MTLLVYHLLVTHCRQRLRIPVHHTGAAVNQTLVVKVHKHAYNRLIAYIVHRECRAIPVAAGAKLAQLIEDDASILLLPLPGILHIFVAAQVALVYAALGKHLHHLGLGRNTCVVRSRHPAGILAHHTCTAYQHVLNSIVQHMTPMQHTWHIRRRNHHRVRFAAVRFRMKQFLLQPKTVPFLFNGTRIVFRCNFHYIYYYIILFKQLLHNLIHQQKP